MSKFFEQSFGDVAQGKKVFASSVMDMVDDENGKAVVSYEHRAFVAQTKMVEVDGEKLIKQAFSEIAPSTTDNQLTGAVDGLVDAPSTKNAEKTAEVDGVISVLQATIDTLQGQLEVKDRQIEELNARLAEVSAALLAAQQTAAAAQALHAGTIQQQLLTGEAGADQQGQEPEQKRGWFSKLFGK